MTLNALTVVVLFASALPIAAEFRVGFASADITPPIASAGGCARIVRAVGRAVDRTVGH